MNVEHELSDIQYEDLEFYPDELNTDSSHTTTRRAKYRAQDVAVKTYRDVTEADRIKQEIELLGSLSAHPRILFLIGFVSFSSFLLFAFIRLSFHEGNFSIVTEFMENGSLYNLLHVKKYILSTAEKIQILLDIATGVAWLHSNSPPYIHEDISSTKVLLDVNFRAKLSGISSDRKKAKEARRSQNRCIEHCAPELLLEDSYDEKVDVYSFGILMWELIMGKKPFEDINIHGLELLEEIQIYDRRPDPLPSSPSISQLIKACWSRKPTERPDFQDIINSLEQETIEENEKNESIFEKIKTLSQESGYMEIEGKEIFLSTKVGEGDHGIVWRASWRERVVAVKKPEAMYNELKDRFIEEMRIMMQVSPHPKIVNLIGWCRYPFLAAVLEFCEGGSLEKLLYNQSIPLSTKQVYPLIKQVAEGMQHLHTHNIIHRDLAARK